MKKKYILGYCYLSNQKCFFEHLTLVTLTFNPVTPKPIGFSAIQDGCVDQVWRRQVKAFSSYLSETFLAQLTPVTLTFDPMINRVHNYATQDGCVDQVWESLVKTFSCYWSEMVLVHLTKVTLKFDAVTPQSIGFIHDGSVD